MMASCIRRPRLLSTLLETLVVLLLAPSACSTVHKEKPSVQAHSWFASVREAIGEHVKDTERARKLLALVNRADTDLIELAATAEAYKARTRELNADYDATRKDFVGASQAYIASGATVVARLMGHNDAMREIATADEWGKIFSEEGSVYDVLKGRE